VKKLRRLLERVGPRVRPRDGGWELCVYDLFADIVDELETLRQPAVDADKAEEVARLKQRAKDAEWWLGRTEKMRKERDEARAEEPDETLGLRLQLAGAQSALRMHRQAAERWEESWHEAQDAIAELAAHIDSVNADAEIGALVRGMRSCTRLVKGSAFYWAEIEDRGQEWQRVELRTGATSVSSLTTTPAAALRAIQEEESDA